MTETSGVAWLDQMLEPGEIATFAERVCGRLQKDLKPKFKLALPHLLVEQIADRLPDDLHIDVLGFLAEGWNTALELEAARKQSLAAPGSNVIATLGRHSIARDLKPNIVVTYGERQSFEVDAAITVEGVFDGVELAFEKGRLASVGSGQCELTVQLKVADQSIGQPHKLKSWRLPGRYPLDAVGHGP